MPGLRRLRSGLLARRAARVRMSPRMPPLRSHLRLLPTGRHGASHAVHHLEDVLLLPTVQLPARRRTPAVVGGCRHRRGTALFPGGVPVRLRVDAGTIDPARGGPGARRVAVGRRVFLFRCKPSKGGRAHRRLGRPAVKLDCEAHPPNRGRCRNSANASVAACGWPGPAERCGAGGIQAGSRLVRCVRPAVIRIRRASAGRRLPRHGW